MSLIYKLLIRPCLLSLFCCATFAAPIDDIDATTTNLTRLVKRLGEDQDHPVEATFTIDGWSDLGEQDCYSMLCVFRGKRV